MIPQLGNFRKDKSKPTLVHTCNPRIWEAEGGEPLARVKDGSHQLFHISPQSPWPGERRERKQVKKYGRLKEEKKSGVWLKQWSLSYLSGSKYDQNKHSKKKKKEKEKQLHNETWSEKLKLETKQDKTRA